MYRSLIDNMSMIVANEFMYGVVMGHSMSLAYADELPKLEKIRDPVTDKLVKVKYTLPSGVVIEQEAKDSVGGQPMMEMLGRMGVADKLEDVLAQTGTPVAPGPDTIQ